MLQRSIILPALLCLSVAASSSHPLALRQRLLRTRTDDQQHRAKNELNRNLKQTRSSLLDWKRVLLDRGSRPFRSLLDNGNAKAYGIDKGNNGKGKAHAHGHEIQDDVDNSQSNEEEGSSASSGEFSSSSDDVSARKLKRGRLPGISKGGKGKADKGKSDKGNASGRSKGKKGKGNKGNADDNFSIYFPDQRDDDDGSSASSGESSSSTSSGDVRARKLERGRLPDMSKGEKGNAYGRGKGKSDKGNAPGRGERNEGISHDDWLPDQRDDDDDASASSGESSSSYSSSGDVRARKLERGHLSDRSKGGKGKADKGNAFGHGKGNKGSGMNNFSYLFPRDGDRDSGRNFPWLG